MTTSIVVRAHHGWPVDVSRKNPKTGEQIGDVQRVQPDAEEVFCVFDTQDLLIHEVQPTE